MQNYLVGPQFQGIKMIPPGTHFIGYSAVGRHGDMAPVTWFFAHLALSEVAVRQWDSTTELLLPLEDQDEVLKLALHIYFGPGTCRRDLTALCARQRDMHRECDALTSTRGLPRMICSVTRSGASCQTA